MGDIQTEKGGSTHWLPPILHAPFALFSGSLAALAFASSLVLLLFDVQVRLFPHTLTHAPISAAPLLLIGASYIALQPLTRPRPMELLQRLMLGSAFILWGVDQLMPPGKIATLIGDVVITLYVIDLGLIIKDHLRKEDWNTP